MLNIYPSPAGSTDHELRVYAVVDPEDEQEADGQLQDHTAASAGDRARSNSPAPAAAAPASSAPTWSSFQTLRPMGSVKRGAGGSERVSRLRFDEAGGMLAVQGTGKSLEIFR